MSTERSFMEFIADQLKDAGQVTYRKMFGEYAVYLGGKVCALVCDNRLYIKPTLAGRKFIGVPVEAPPYPGAKDYFLIEDGLDDGDWLSGLVRATADELPDRPAKKGGKR